MDSTIKLNNSSLSFNSIPPDYQHVLLTSPSDNRLHELVEYEVSVLIFLWKETKIKHPFLIFV